jgi:hypothetical protein
MFAAALSVDATVADLVVLSGNRFNFQRTSGGACGELVAISENDARAPPLVCRR